MIKTWETSELMDNLKAIVDKVKNYTNLFVIGSLEIRSNKTALDEAGDYVVDAGLNLIVFLRTPALINWMVEVKQKYGAKFLGV